MNPPEHDQALAPEIARQKQRSVQQGKRLRWLLGIDLLAGVAVGLAVWFWEPPVDRNNAHFGFALGLAAAAFLVGGMLGRFLFPKPSATCPRCGCDWDAESDNNAQTWLAWDACPGCGLNMNEQGGKQP